MRLIAGCTLDAEHIAAIERGTALHAAAAAQLASVPLAPPNAEAEGALELLAWLAARGHLDARVAVPCNAAGKPVPDTMLFHAKTGAVEDRAGNRLAWTGSLNETAAGWTRNWEEFSVFAAWGSDRARVDRQEERFARLCANRAKRALVLDVPEAARRDLMRFLPRRALRRLPAGAPRTPRTPPPPRPEDEEAPAPPPVQTPPPPPVADRRGLAWAAIAAAARMARGGARVGETAAAVEPWPHQLRAFERLYAGRPRAPGLLPSGTEARPLGNREYGLRAPGMPREVRVTTNAELYADQPESLELWSPGNPLFRAPDFPPPESALPNGKTLWEILDE